MFESPGLNVCCTYVFDGIQDVSWNAKPDTEIACLLDIMKTNCSRYRLADLQYIMVAYYSRMMEVL